MFIYAMYIYTYTQYISTYRISMVNFMLEGGHRLFYRVLGNGPKKMVMVMALSANHTQWEDQFAHFGVERSDEFSVCLLDNRSVCWSDAPAGRWRTTDLAKDVWCVVDQLGWTGIHLVGLSMGGMICLEAALARPDLLLSLILISTHGGGWGTVPPMHGHCTDATGSNKNMNSNVNNNSYDNHKETIILITRIVFVYKFMHIYIYMYRISHITFIYSG